MKKYFCLFFLSFSIVLSAQEYTVNTVPNPKAMDVNHYVCNPDHIIDTQTVEEINAVLQSLEAETQAEVAVVILNSIGNEDIVDFGVQLFEKWGIGKKQLDNGLLILFVSDQHAVRFETGYGLEGILPDAICKRIQMQVMIPEFKNGNYGKGLLAGVTSAAALIRKEPMPDLTNDKSGINILYYLLMTVALYVLLSLVLCFLERNSIEKIRKNIALKNNQERYEAFLSTKSISRYGVGCFLPLLGIFILFFFGKEKITFRALPLLFSFLSLIPVNMYRKSWKKKFRKQPVSCPQCGIMMHCLSNEAGSQYLEPAARMENQLHSVEYDVFQCDNCRQNAIYKYDNKTSKYKRCSQCGTKAFYLQKTITLNSPTYTSSGTANEIFVCKFCNHKQSEQKILPRLTRSSSGSSGGGFSSGGSFGGGRSGGGGATSRW